MVKKSTLSKLSTTELEKYIKEGNNFTPEAVELALEILQEKGRFFSEAEITNIHKISRDKKEAEKNKNKEEIEYWKDHITTDISAIALYSRTLILVTSIFLGTCYGAILLCLNLIKIKKYPAAIFSLLFGLMYIPVQYYGTLFLIENGISNNTRYSLEKSFILIGPFLLLLIWVTLMPEKISYRAQSYTIPIILGIIMLLVIFTNYNDLFSSYFLLKFQ